MLGKSGLGTRKYLFFFFCIHLSCCTEKLTSYTPEEGVMQWVYLDKDSSKAVTFFARVENEGLAASAEVSTKYSELNHYKLLDISFGDLNQDTALISLIIRDQDHTKEFRFVDSTWESALGQSMSIEHLDDTLSVIFTYERLYKLPFLPAGLQLNYRIATQDTLVTGSRSFKAVVTEVPAVMRWH